MVLYKSKQRQTVPHPKGSGNGITYYSKPSKITDEFNNLFSSIFNSIVAITNNLPPCSLPVPQLTSAQVHDAHVFKLLTNF